MEFNIVSRRTEIAYKAEEADEVAQQAKVQGCASMVNAAVVQSEQNRSFVTICFANYLRFASGVLLRGDLSHMRSGNREHPSLNYKIHHPTGLGVVYSIELVRSE